jgi:hypothetical protein
MLATVSTTTLIGARHVIVHCAMVPTRALVTRVARCAEEARGGLELSWPIGMAAALQRLCERAAPTASLDTGPAAVAPATSGDSRGTRLAPPVEYEQTARSGRLLHVTVEGRAFPSSTYQLNQATRQLLQLNLSRLCHCNRPTAQRIPQKVLTLSQKLDECKPLVVGHTTPACADIGRGSLRVRFTADASTSSINAYTGAVRANTQDAVSGLGGEHDHAPTGGLLLGIRRSPGERWLPAVAAAPGRGPFENKHSTVVKSLPPPSFV